MAKLTIPGRVQESLRQFLSQKKRPELIATYLQYVEQLLNLEPVLFVKDKLVFKSKEDAVRIL